ncbi:MAG: hypothetical protein ACJ8G5_11980 [Burkholderiales bacterium]
MTAPIRALVVDDLRDSSESLARMLQFMGCSATWVTRAAKAMAVSGYGKPVDLEIVESMLRTVAASRR